MVRQELRHLRHKDSTVVRSPPQKKVTVPSKVPARSAGYMLRACVQGSDSDDRDNTPKGTRRAGFVWTMLPTGPPGSDSDEENKASTAIDNIKCDPVNAEEPLIGCHCRRGASHVML